MSRYSPKRQDGTSSRTYPEQTTATSRQYPLSSRSFGTADNSPGKTYKRNSPVSRASSFSAGRSSSSSRKNDTSETSGESPSKLSKASGIPQASNMNRDGTSSLHSRLSSRTHQDTTTGKTDSSHPAEHKSSRVTSESNLPSPRRKVNEDSTHAGQRSFGRGHSESPSRSSQDSDGGSPSNIPMRTSYRRSLEGDKNNDSGTSRLLLRGSGRLKTGAGRTGISSSESVDTVSSRTQLDSKKDPSANSDITTTSVSSLLLNKTSPDGIKSPSPTSNSIYEAESLLSKGSSKTGIKSEVVSKALSPPRTIDAALTKQTFDRSDVKYHSCRSRIPTPNSPSGSRNGSESPVRQQKLSSHSFSNFSEDAGSSKDTAESRAERIARYKELRRRELASKIKSKLDPEICQETEPASATKTSSEEKSKYIKPVDVSTESSTAAKASATRSATADSSKIICGLKVSKNIADRAKKRQERMLRNSQHLSAELIGRRAKISAVCIKTDADENGESLDVDALPAAEPDSLSLKPDTTLTFSQGKDQLQPSPLREIDSISPTSLLSSSDNDKDSTYQQLTSESDFSPDDKRLSLTELESLPEITSCDELTLSPERETVVSEKRVNLSESSPSLEELLVEKTEDIRPLSEETSYLPEIVPQVSKHTFYADRLSKVSPDKETQQKRPVTSPCTFSSSPSEKIAKVKSTIGSRVDNLNITNTTPALADDGKTESRTGNYDFHSKSSVKISETKDDSSSYGSSNAKSKFHDRHPDSANIDVVPENQGDEAPTSLGKLRTRPPPSTVLYTKRLLESVNVKKDQKRVDYDLQKELDWLEHRRYQIADESADENKKKLSVLEMVRAAENKTDTDEEVPRKPLGRTMSEARGKDAAQSRKDILAMRISNLGRTQSFGMAPNKKLATSVSLDEERPVLSAIRDNHLDELLMKNVAYLDDENIPKDPLVRSLHPAENLKLRKSLRKKKVAKLTSVPEKGTSEIKGKDKDVIEEYGTEEVSASKATLKLKESSPSTTGPAPLSHKTPAPSHAPETRSTGVTPKVLHVIEKPARPTLVQNHPSETAAKQLHSTQPAITKPASSTVTQGKVSDTSQKQLHVTQPPTKKSVSPTGLQNRVSDAAKKQSPVTQSSVTKPVSPTAAGSHKVSNVTARKLPTSENRVTERVTEPVPAKTDVTDSAQRKRVRSLSRGRPVTEGVTDATQVKPVLKKKRDRSESHLKALEEDSDTKGRDENQDLSRPGLTATKKPPASGNLASEGITQPRLSRQRVKPDNIPAPILDVIKASLDYEQSGTQSKAEPSRSKQPAPAKSLTHVSTSTKTVLDAPLAQIHPHDKDEPPQLYSPVVSRRFSDVNKSTVTTVNRVRMSDDIGVSLAKPVNAPSLKTRADSLGSVTISPRTDLGSRIRKASLPETNNSSKISFQATNFTSREDVSKNLPPLQETTYSSPSENNGIEDGLPVGENIVSKKTMPLRADQFDPDARSIPSVTYRPTEDKKDISKDSAKDFTDVELFIREDNHPEKKDEEESAIPESNFLSTSKVSLAPKNAERVVSSQMKKPASSTTIPEDGQPRKTILSSEVEKQETSLIQGSKINHASVATTISQPKTSVANTTAKTAEVKKSSMTSLPPSDVINTTSTAKTSVEVKQPSVTSTQLKSLDKNDSVTLTTASVTTPMSKTVLTSVTSISPEVKPASPVTSPTSVTSVMSDTPVTTVASTSVTSAPQTRVTSVISSKSVTNKEQKPAVTKVVSSNPVTSTASTSISTTSNTLTKVTPVTETTSVTSATVTSVSTTSKTLTKAPITATTSVTPAAVTPATATSNTLAKAPVTVTTSVTAAAVTSVSTTSKTVTKPVTATTSVTSATATSVSTTSKTVSKAPVTATTSVTSATVTSVSTTSKTVSKAPVTATTSVTSATATSVSTTSKMVTKAPVTAATSVTSATATSVSTTSKTVTKAPVTAATSVTSHAATSISTTSKTVTKAPVTVATSVTSDAATSVSTTSKMVTKATSVTPAACVTSTINSTAVTTMSLTSKTSADLNKPVSVTCSTSVTKSEPVTSVVTGQTTTVRTPVSQTSSVTSTNSVMNHRSISLSPTLPESRDLARSLELTQTDIENGNLMTRSAHFSQPRMSEGSLFIPRRGILKRTGSLRANDVESELIDPELAKVFQARRIKEKSENPTSDLAEEDSIFDDKPYCQESLLSEVIAEEESDEKPLSVADRISQMETRIIVSTSGYTTPKTPRSRLGSVPRTFPETENKTSILPQEELFNKLTDLARSKEATQERQKRYHRSRDDWRTRTQPVTLKEVEQADSLESVCNFRALVMKRSSIDIFEQLQEQDKRRRRAGPRTEYPQPYLPEKRNRKTDKRYNTQPVTAAELMAIPEGETISLAVLKSKMQALKDSKTDSGIVSSGSDIEKESQGSDSTRSLTTDNDDEDFTQMSVAARASLFRQMEEKSKKSASGAKRYIDRKKRERSRTQPITEEEVKTAAEIADEEAAAAAAKKKQLSTESNEEPRVVTEKQADEAQAENETEEKAGPAITLERLISVDIRDEEKDVTKHSDDLARQTLADKVKLFSTEKEVATEKFNRTDAPVMRRRNRRCASRFNTQPITTEEIENVFRISPLAISLVKPPDPDILKGLPLNAQRELTAQYAEATLSQQGSRAGSRPGSLCGSRRGSIEESEESKEETKGILKMADYQKDLQQVKSILKTESGRDSPDREIKSILKNEGERKDREPGPSILKQDSNEQVKPESETRSILKSSEPEPRRSSKQLDSEPRGILKVSEPDVSTTAPKTSEPKSVLKKDSSWDKNEPEPRGILKKESSFDLKKEPERSVLKRSDSKENKDSANQDNLRGILKQESSIETLSGEDSDIGEVFAKAEEQKTPVVPEGRKKEYRRGSDERYLTQPVTNVEKKSPESPRKLQRYGSRHHKTQPVTPEEKKEASQIIQPVVKMSGSLAERLQALQKSGEEDWKRRLTKQTNSASPSPDREIRSCSPETPNLRPANLSERMSLLKSSQTSWRSRVEESDAKAFTVEGKLSKSGQTIRERSVVTKVRQTVKSTESDQSTSSTSPTTPTKGEWKIPIPKVIIASESTFEETTENQTTIVKLPELKDDGLDQFFVSSTNLSEKNELLDISVDDFDEIFQTSRNVLIHNVKARPKKKVQARSKNPLKSRSANLERQEYEEYKTNVAEIEMKRIKKEALSKDAGFAEAALAGLASKENFSKIELRKTDTSVPSPGAHRYLPYKPLMLLHVKGRRHVQTRLVEPHARNVNQGDCYVLVTPDKVINWIGEYSNIIEKAKSADIAAHVQQKKDMGYKSSSGIITIDSRKMSGEIFWSLLDGHETECQECGGVDEDEIYENAIISTNMIYEIEKNMLIPYEDSWGDLPKYEMLQSNQVFIFDFGAEVYIWQGKKAAPQKRKLGLELAQQLWDKGYNYEMSSINPLFPLHEDGVKCSSDQRPPWALIAKVNENMETVVFREKFADWPDSTRLIKVKIDSNSNKTENGDLIPYDAQKLIEKETPEAFLMTLDGSQVGRGTSWSEDMDGFIQEFDINTLAVTVWHILEFDHYKIDLLSNGQFHEGDTYVVRWEYRIVAKGGKVSGKRAPVGRERCAYFFWQGQTSTITEKGASALMTVELDEERGPQVRVLQGKEPPCFLNLFQGRMVVHIGKREEEETNTQGPWRFYSVRHEKGNEMCLIEIQAQITSLRSRSTFILFNAHTGKVFIWHGAKSPQNTRTLALTAVNSIQERHPLEMGLPENVDVNITEMDEGSEKPEFWMALRSRDRSQYMSLLNDPRSYNFSLRLFQFTSVSGVIEVTEIRNPTISPTLKAPYPFLQSDLYKVSQPALFLLDCGYEVFLWQGWWPEGDEEIENVHTGSAQARLMVERRCAMQTAVDYCQAKTMSEKIKPYLVFAGLEPLKFTNLFPFWDVDETVKELSLKDGKCDGDLVSVEDELDRLSLVQYSFKDLLERPLPEDVDPLKLESYLSVEEFEEVLQMTQSEYYCLPAWKQSKLKQDIGLF